MTENDRTKLEQRANISTYYFYPEDEQKKKYIILYDDHRYLLNVLYYAEYIFEERIKIPNLIYFDYHTDACESIGKKEILDKMHVKQLDSNCLKQFYNFVEFDLDGRDNNWLQAGFNLNLIKDAILIGKQDDDGIPDGKKEFKNKERKSHYLYSIPHLKDALDYQGCISDINWNQNAKELQSILQIKKCTDYDVLFNDIDNNSPLVLDFDLDCFSYSCLNNQIAWPESIFKDMYVDEYKIFCCLKDIIKRCSFITICREPKYCSGLGESNKILTYLDKYFFNGCLETSAME